MQPTLAPLADMASPAESQTRGNGLRPNGLGQDGPAQYETLSRRALINV
jgi:hypothetical protein